MKLMLDPNYFIDTSQGIDISIPLSDRPDSVRAWYCDPIKIEPVVANGFVGDVNQGGSVNFRNIFLNPHGNGTHTECVGHISREPYTLNQCLKEFHFFAAVISVEPKKVVNNEFNQMDLVIDGGMIAASLTKLSDQQTISAVVIRTQNDEEEKLTRNYSNTNPPYLTEDAISTLLQAGVDHLIIDLPSVDREVDHGKLAAHHLFWNYPQKPQLHRTITEMVNVPDQVKDGIYLLNIQITSLENDASPSKLVLYEIQAG